jgi:catalase
LSPHQAESPNFYADELIAAIAPQETCDAGVFLPGNVTDGIAGPSDDPIFAVRSPAYIVSFTRRKQ